jgi:hypothetical protein
VGEIKREWGRGRHGTWSWGGGGGNPRLGKVMAMGGNPFLGCLPAKNGHQWIRRMHNDVMLLWLQEIERKLSIGDRFELDSHEVPSMALYGEKL